MKEILMTLQGWPLQFYERSLKSTDAVTRALCSYRW